MHRRLQTHNDSSLRPILSISQNNMGNAVIYSRRNKHPATNKRENRHTNFFSIQRTITKTPSKRRNRSKTNRSNRRKRTYSQQHTPRPTNNNINQRLTLRSETTNKNNSRTNRTTKPAHNKKQPKTNRPPFRNHTSKIRRLFQIPPKSTRPETKRPVIPNNSPLRPKTCLLHQTTQTNTKRRNGKNHNGTQKTKHHPKIYASTRGNKRRMDSRRNNKQKQSHATNRPRLHLCKHSTRRNNDIQKGEISLGEAFIKPKSRSRRHLPELAVVASLRPAQPPVNSLTPRAPMRILMTPTKFNRTQWQQRIT